MRFSAEYEVMNEDEGENDFEENGGPSKEKIEVQVLVDSRLSEFD